MYLPKAPDDVEKYLYLRGHRPVVYSLGLVSFVSLCMGMWLFVFASASFAWFAVFAVIITAYLGLSYLVGILGEDFDLRKHKVIVSGWSSVKPSVDVFLPCCGEPIEVLRNTYSYVAKLNWPSFKVYVLDDGASEEVRRAASEFGFEYVVRPNRGELKKAGNLRHAFAQTHAEFIMILDADFCPRPDFLSEVIPYFLEDQRIGLVQTPQYFSVEEDQSWVEKGASYVQELFYRLIQVSRDRWGAAICVGSCSVSRRSALAPHGGTAAIGFSEDVHTGFYLVNDGWKLKYIPINLAKGLCPDRLPGFFIQQYRWAMGSITLFLNKKFWLSNLTVMQKICYLSGMLYYIGTGVGVFAMGLPSLVLLYAAPHQLMWYNLAFSIPSLFYGTFIMARWSRARFGWYVPRVRLVGYYAHIFALVDKLRDSAVAWVPTGAARRVSRFNSFKSLMFAWTSFITIGTACGIAYRVGDFPWHNFVPLAVLTAYNYWISFTVLRDQD